MIPPGSMLDPQPPAAVAAGNVETSQCIVDALYGALGVLAASQGTMNNLTFGDARLQYYETICGGAGAGPDFDGCDAVQTHMTNSRLTDPEILEAQYPVLVREFAIRRGSGGAGRHHGGDGMVRRLEFSRALLGRTARQSPPHRALRRSPAAAAPAPGRGAHPPRADGAVETLGATARFEVAAGDELTILTPGGGGFGKARALKRGLSRAGSRSRSPTRRAACEVAERFTDTGRTRLAPARCVTSQVSKLAGLAGGEAEQQVELAFGERLRGD